MKGLRSIPRILKINEVDGYHVSVLFNNGESRIIDFRRLFKEVFKKRPGSIGYELIDNEELFKEVEIIGTTLGWKKIGMEGINDKGEKVFHPYDLDPIVLYDNSEPDEKRNVVVGLKIKQARLEAGMTQEELANRSGTSKHYISRLENNKSDIELMTLKKIVEAGLGKYLKIQII